MATQDQMLITMVQDRTTLQGQELIIQMAEEVIIRIMEEHVLTIKITMPIEATI